MTERGSMKYKQKLIKQIKAAGQELIDRAEDMVGKEGGITDLAIVCTFEQDAAPEIVVHRSCIVRNWIQQEREIAEQELAERENG